MRRMFMLSAAAAAAMVLSVGAQAAVKDGTFEGTGAGRGGPSQWPSPLKRAESPM